MFFLFSKLLDFLLLPLLWVLVLLVAALLTKQPHRQRQYLAAGLALLLLLTNPALSNEALRAWELRAVPLAALPRRADAAVLLSGITAVDKAPPDRVYLGEGADRLTNALWLWRAGRVRRIIVAGGSGSVMTKTHSEAQELATLLRLAGVPGSAIVLEDHSRNTHENALNVKALTVAHPQWDTLVLVTSAFHQRRAQGCFARVGLPVIPFPAGFRTADRSFSPNYWLLPDAGALVQWSLLLHEMAGWAVYKLRGWC